MRAAVAGRVVFVGAGPGDPRLLTLRGAEVLARADLVVHDAEVHADILALAGGAARVAAGADVGATLIAAAREGKTVARVVAGDPFFFAQGDVEVAHVRKAGVAVEVVAGVVAVVALGACAGLTMTRAADASPSVAVVRIAAPELLGLHDWAKLATSTDVLAIAAAPSAVADIVRSLVFAGRSGATPAALVARVSLPSQRVVAATLGEMAEHVGALVEEATELLLVVGDAVSRRVALAWFEQRPLFGKRILVTRAREQAGGTAALLRERGAEAVVVPTIELHPPADPAALARAVARLASTSTSASARARPRGEWVAFTSANGVERVWAEVTRQGLDARAFGRVKLAAVGPGTARALEGHGLRADVVAKEFRGEGLAEELLRAMTAPSFVLIARAEAAREVLPEALRAAGHEVEIVAAYATRAPSGDVVARLVFALESRALDAVMLTSASTIDNLCDLVGPRAPELLAHVKVASIGPITTAAAQKRGVRVDVTAAEFTVAGLVDALERTY